MRAAPTLLAELYTMRTSLHFAAIAAVLAGSLAAQGALGGPCYVSQLGTPLGLGDDQVAANNALGFSFPGPAGAVTSIDISSNGFVWLGSNTNSECCNGDINTFLTGMPRIAAMWMDLYPPGNGDVYFNAIPASGSVPASAVVTWFDVPEIGTSTLQTIQLQMYADGSFSIIYDNRCANTFHDALVGVTQGNGATLNAVDFSAITAGTPHISGTNPTVLELLQSTWDLAGRAFAFVPNGQGGYLVFDRPGCTLANATTFGRGCPLPIAAYEYWVTPSVTDLSNTAIEFTPTGTGYVAIPTTGFFTGYSAGNSFFDDQVLGPFALPFTFSYPGGSTNAIDISSNGFIWLQTGNTNPRCCNGDPVQFLADPASIAALWMDLYPPGGGNIYFDTTPTEVHITWAAVPEYFNGAPQTAQITLRNNGSFRLAYQSVVNGAHDLLVGFSQGLVTVDPGSVDFSAGPVVISGGGSPMALSSQASSRPVIGTTYTMDLDQGNNGAAIGIMVLGLSGYNPGLPLDAIGMTGCELYANLDSLSTVILGGPVTPFGFAIPNNTALAGLPLWAQGASLLATANPLGIATSNGIAMVLGF
jgi:hypothetical protein